MSLQILLSCHGNMIYSILGCVLRILLFVWLKFRMLFVLVECTLFRKVTLSVTLHGHSHVDSFCLN